MKSEDNPINYSLDLPEGWIRTGLYSTATHYLVGYLMKPGSRFKHSWQQFEYLWDQAKGLEQRIKQEEAQRLHQGFGDPKIRQTVNRALKTAETKPAGIDIIRLDKILIKENLPPLISLDPDGFVAKTPGSKREAQYRKNGVPEDIVDPYEVLKYIKDNGPAISETKSTKARNNRDPRIKAQRVLSEFIRTMEERALKNFLLEVANEFGVGYTEIDIKKVLENMR
jgi:hypothetical protein